MIRKLNRLNLSLVILMLVVALVVLGGGKGACNFGSSGGSSHTSSGSSGTSSDTWTIQFGTTEDDVVWGVSTDTSGNIYVAGRTLGDLGDVITNTGGSDIFVAKYDSDGVKQWTRQLGTTGHDIAYGVATDTSDNIYVVGDTEGNLDGQTNTGETDAFVIKYNSAGTKQWTRLLGTTAADRTFGVATDTSGNIYVAGDTSGDLGDDITNTGSYDLFVAKYDSDGVKQWTRQLGTTGIDMAYGMATDASDNIYAVGTTWGDLDGNTNAGAKDICVVKYDTDGVKQWTRQLGTTEDDGAWGGVAIDTSGNIYVSANTWGNLDGQTNAAGAAYNWSYSDAVLIKYNSAGTKQWTRLWGTIVDEGARGLVIDTSGNIYVSGFTNGDLDGNTSAGERDFFVVKYNSAGVKQWTRQIGTPEADVSYGGTDLAIDSSDNIYVVGDTEGNLDGNTNAGAMDVVVIKYNSAGEKQ